MGEISDMMMEGLLCSWCGVYLDRDAPVFQQDGSSPACAQDDYPVICHDCRSSQELEAQP